MKFLKWLLAEILLAYTTLKKFVVQTLQVFKAPPVLNAYGTVVASNKTSAKRVWAAALMLVGIRQLCIADHFGALVAIGAGIVLFVIAALTKS